MRRHILIAATLVPALLWGVPATAEPLIYGLQVEQAERRFDDGSDLYAWDFDALVGTDELKVVWRSEAEYLTEGNQFETLENQLRLQKPISTFFDAVVGVRLDTPRGEDRAYGVVGVKGLAPQWFEIDADLYVGETSFVRIEAEYESALTVQGGGMGPEQGDAAVEQMAGKGPSPSKLRSCKIFCTLLMVGCISASAVAQC